MCESLEASLSLSLDAFCGTEIQEVSRLKTESEQMTESAETSFAKYLNGRHALGTKSDRDSWNKLSDQLVHNGGGMGTATTTTTTMFGKWRNETTKNWRSSSTSGSNNNNNSSSNNNNGSIMMLNNSDDSGRRRKGEQDPQVTMAVTAANLRLTLEHIRLAQASAELKRFQLLKKLVSIKVPSPLLLLLFLCGPPRL